MNVYRAEIHGNLIEVRQGDLGGQIVLLNGHVVSEKPFAGLLGASHFFEIRDENDRACPVEARLFDKSKLGVGKYQVVISVNGRERCRIEKDTLNRELLECRNCGYSMRGLPVENGEIRCPECGRHTSAAMLDVGSLKTNQDDDDASSAQS